MTAPPPLVLATVTGLISGLLLSIPVGPINLAILNEGLRRGFRWAVMIGLGATLMEVIYCAIAFTGFASFFNRGLVKAAMELFSFAFLFYLGLRFLQAKSIPHSSRIEERVEEKLHPHSAFWIGFVRVLGNPGVFVFWIILAANFLSREWVGSTWASKAACVAGVAGGCLAWFLTLAYLVSFRQRRMSEKSLLRMEHGSGVCLLALALLHGVNILWQMHSPKPPLPPPSHPDITLFSRPAPERHDLVARRFDFSAAISPHTARTRISNTPPPETQPDDPADAA